jgi:hypothetical protein
MSTRTARAATPNGNSATVAPIAAEPACVPTIAADAVFTIGSLRATLGLRAGTLPRELRLKRLRHSKRAGRVFILGAWVIEWIAAGEVHK